MKCLTRKVYDSFYHFSMATLNQNNQYPQQVSVFIKYGVCHKRMNIDNRNIYAVAPGYYKEEQK